MPASEIGEKIAASCSLYEPTTATAFSRTARRAHSAAATDSLPSSHTRTRSSRPPMPPPEFTHCS